MSSKKIVIAIIALTLVMIPLLSAESNDGAVIQDSNAIEISGFNERSNGTIRIPLENSDTAPIDIIVYVTFLGSDERLAETKVTIPAKEGDVNGSAIATLSFRIGSPGTYFVEVFFIKESDGSNATILTEIHEINVDSSIWANTTTYIVIIVVIIVIGIAVWLKLRNSSATKKDTTGAFTAMEAQKRASREKKQYNEVQDTEYTAVTESQEVATTEKKEYSGRAASTKKKTTSSKRKSDPSSRKSSKRK